MSGSSPYQVPKQPGRWRAITLAVLVHLGLLAFLWFGIRWQSETPLAVEAEIWDPKVREAAPLPPEPQEQPEPEPVKPVTPPAPTPPPPPVEEPPVVKPDVVKPDIALEKEKEKKRKEQDKQRELEKQKQAKLEKEKQLKLAKEKQDKEDRLKKEQQEADKKLAKQKDDAAAKKKAEADKLAAEKKQKQDAADSKAADQRRKADLARMMNQATTSASSSTGGSGDAAKSQGPRGTPDYANKIAARIRSNTTFDLPSDLAGNPPVEYAVELFPDGSVRSVRLKKPSGVPGFDEAVARAINKSQPFPPDKDGKVPNSISVIHKPKDSN